MSMTWQTVDRLRPDPYLDWEANLRATAKDGPDITDIRWCPVEIELIPEDGEMLTEVAYLSAVNKLESAVVKQKLADDPDGSGNSFVASEFEYYKILELKQTLNQQKDAAIVNPAVPSNFRFYIYRPEHLIYDNGGFRVTGVPPFFRIVNAGPPIRNFTKTRSYDSDMGPGIVWRNDGEKPVAIGIIDDGIAFANAQFCLWHKGVRATRIQSLWLQDIAKANTDGSAVIGTILSKAEIDDYLKTCRTDEAIYRAVGQLDHTRQGHKPLAFRRAHGTFCLDLATGSDPGPKPAATAAASLQAQAAKVVVKTRETSRPIFAVQLPPEAIADISGVTIGSYVLQGVRHIMQAADLYDNGIPLILNFSYGILAGPKDGSHHLEQALDALVAEREARGGKTFIVMSAGNSRLLRANARFTLRPGDKPAAGEIDWLIQPDDKTANFVEIWLDGDDLPDQAGKVRLMLKPPGGPAETITLDQDKPKLLFGPDGPIAMMGVQRGLGRAGNRIRAFIATGPTAARAPGFGGRAPSGRWRIGLSTGGSAGIDARLYIQRDGTPAGYPHKGRSSRFDHAGAYSRDPVSRNYSAPTEDCPIKRDDTLSAIATGKRSIVVGALRTSEGPDDVEPARYSSAGSTKSGKGLDFAAIADFGSVAGMVKTGTLSGSSAIMNGTSVAAPQVVRLLADGLAGYTVSPNPGHAAKPGPTPMGIYVAPLDEDVRKRRRYGLSARPKAVLPPGPFQI